MIREPTGSLTRADASECRTATQASEIEVFDFLSFDHVHLPFNEGYIRILKAAYPNDRISFRAAKGHVERLAPRLADLAGITFQPCKSFATPFGVSHHNPFAGRWAARQCLNVIAGHTARRCVRLTALLGFNASLLAVIGRRGRRYPPHRYTWFCTATSARRWHGGLATPSSALPISFLN